MKNHSRADARRFSSVRKGAFTLVELLVVVLIIGILAAIALPNFIGAQGRARTALVKSNMHTVQVAAEAYATDSGGIYAADCSGGGCGPYFPGGGMILGGAVGIYPQNVISGAPTQPTAGGYTLATRAQAATAVAVPAGVSTYDPIAAGGANVSYVVCGGDPNGKSVPGIGGKCLVLSNQ